MEVDYYFDPKLLTVMEWKIISYFIKAYKKKRNDRLANPVKPKHSVS